MAVLHDRLQDARRATATQPGRTTVLATSSVANATASLESADSSATSACRTITVSATTAVQVRQAFIITTPVR